MLQGLVVHLVPQVQVHLVPQVQVPLALVETDAVLLSKLKEIKKIGLLTDESHCDQGKRQRVKEK